MESEQLHILLKKYWNGETSIMEEEQLQNFFCDGDVPLELQQFAPVFVYRETQRNVCISDGFDKRLKAALKQSKANRYITIRIFAPVLHVAASIVLIAGLAVSLFFIAKQNNNPHFAETYNDPNAAIKHATFALEKLSDALRTGENVSLQTLHDIDKMKIDWSMLDSLSTTDEMPSSIDKDTIEAVEIL